MYGGEQAPFGSSENPAQNEQTEHDYGRAYEGREAEPTEEDEQKAIDRELGQSEEDAAQSADELRALQEQMRAAGKQPKHIEQNSDDK